MRAIPIVADFALPKRLRHLAASLPVPRLDESSLQRPAILKRQTSGEPPPAAQEMDALSDREFEVFQLIGEGLTSREICERLRLVATTLDSYRARIKKKLALKNAAELYQRAALWVAAPGA